jgi:glycosyltransferase involved in cell wall biosynthesis
MLAGESAVLEAFMQQGLSASWVPTAHTTIKGALAVARELSARHVDCLIVDRPRDLRLGVLASLLHPIRLINRYNLSRAQPPKDLLSRLAYRWVMLTIFVSKTSAERALAAGRYLARRPYRIIREGVGPEFYHDESAAAAFRSRWNVGGRELVVAVGSLTADKRYPFLFEVMSRLGPRPPLLVICGEGPLKIELEAQAAALGIESSFVGLLPPEMLRGAYSAARCLLHACRIETFGLSVLEAMACATPVVAVSAGAIPEVLGDSGKLIPPDNPQRFARELHGILTAPDQARALGLAAQTRARELFSLDRMQQEHVEAIEAVCSASRSDIPIQHVQPAPPGV